MAPAIFAAGVAPDLFVVDSRGTISPDSEKQPSGSYDAIRVYLWAGMSGANSAALLPRLGGFTSRVRELGRPPEKLDPANAVAVRSDFSPIGFSGAVLPFLHAVGEKALLKSQLERLSAAARRAQAGEATNYYDQVLILFGQGWLDGYYRFDEQGRVQPKWSR
jgi:endoglucanase